jgi:hypothetical protein
MQDFAYKNTARGPRDAARLFEEQGTRDQGLLATIVKNLQPQGPQAPGFTSGLPGAAAAQAVTGTPPMARIADPSGALPAAAVGTGISQLQQYYQGQADQEKRDALLNRLLENQAAGGKINVNVKGLS